MSINTTTNRIHNSQQTLKKTNKDNSNPRIFYPKTMMNGFVFGAGAGIGDAIATLFSIRQDIASALDKFKNADYYIKKEMIKKLHENGVNVRGYKKYAYGVQSGSTLPMMMLKRGLMFGTLVGSVGFCVDLYHKNKEKKL